MTPDDIKTVLVVDDLEFDRIIRPLLNVSQFKHVKILRLISIVAVKDELARHFRPKETIIIVNNHAKFEYSELRCEMSGGKFVRYQLRAEWNGQQPVLVYSPLSRTDFLKHPINRIFQDRSHYNGYIQVPGELPDLCTIIQNLEVLSKDELVFEKTKYCDLPGLIGTHIHDLNSALRLREFEKIPTVCRSLSDLIPVEFHADFKISTLLDESKRSPDSIQKTKRIDKIIRDYEGLAKEKFCSWRV